MTNGGFIENKVYKKIVNLKDNFELVKKKKHFELYLNIFIDLMLVGPVLNEEEIFTIFLKKY